MNREQLVEDDCRTSMIRPVGSFIGSYEIIRPLGEGGMGRVYLAEHVRLGRKVALKVLHQEFNERPIAISRFFGEARAANQIQHENIIEITDFVEDPEEDGYYLVMELLEGMDLDHLIVDSGTLPIPRALGIATQMADALNAAHEAGIVHRDLKPENIFLTKRAGQTDFVKILDFGVAKLADGLPGSSEGIDIARTSPGCIIGTPAYMSPEQGAGKAVDYRSDIYSYGVILYNMVTGEQLFSGESYGELLLKHMTAKPRRPTSIETVPHPIPGELEALILKCLEKDPTDRPDNMADIRDRLQKIAEDRSWELMSFDVAPLQRSWRTHWIVAACIAGVVAIGAVGLSATSMWSETEARRDLGSPQTSQGDGEESAKVSVVFVSSPPGATVWREGDEAPLGLTPLKASLDRSELTESFEIRKTGFETIESKIPLSSDGRIVVSLQALPEPPATVDAGAEPEPEPTKRSAERERRSRRDREGGERSKRTSQSSTETKSKSTTPRRDINALVDAYGE